ncbi:MAG: DUF6311 domain-containing protein [Ilumatobacteraceae bacterium]
MSKQALWRWFLGRDLTSIAAGIVGLIFGLWFLGPRNVLPGSTDWLNRGDLASYQLGWEFFRQTPFIQWPLTAVPNYGVSFHTVLVSGNALIELPLKFLRPVLPSTFQYVGMWIVGCFILQGYFAARLLSHFVSDRFIRFVVAAMFVISPALIFRIGIAGHPALGAHWLILWAFYLYFSDRQSHVVWSMLIAIALTVSIYISVMVLCIYLASVGKVLLTGRDARSGSSVARLVFVPSFVGALTFIAMGYLEYGGSAKGTGFFRLNALAFLNPGFSSHDSFSFVLNHFGPVRVRQLVAEEGEGFQYLGLGVILTMPLLAVYMVRHRSTIWWRRLFPLFLVCTFLFLVALSNRVVFVRHEFSYPLPESVLDLRQTFRAATRFAWPMYYLLTLAGVVAIVRLVRGRVAITIVTLMLASVHILDQIPGLTYAHRELSSQPPYRSPLVDPEWGNLARSYKEINLFPNFDLQVGEGSPDAEFWNGEWYHFARFAVENQLVTGFGYFSRPLTTYLKQDNIKMTRELTSGNLEADAIYVLSNPETWKAAMGRLDDKSRALILDGYYVILGPITSK